MAHEQALKLKRLQSERFQLQQALEERMQQRTNLAREVEKLQRLYDAKVREIAELEHPRQKDLTVSEHALLRYLERVRGYDIDALSGAVAPESVRRVALALGTGTYPVETEGYRYRIRVQGTVVTTVLPPSGE